jgi:raffinose/stachyose/melibiose transport system permease protein
MMRRKLYPYFYVLPALLLVGFFILYPVGKGISITFMEYNPLTDGGPFVGLKQFARLFQDKILWNALRNNLLYIGITLVTEVSAGLVLAVLINRVKAEWLSNTYRVILFAPRVLSVSAVSILFGLVFHTQLGLINNGLKAIGLAALARTWLGSTETALLAIIAVSFWSFIGICTILYFASLQRIPPSFYEVAALEGASAFKQFVHITIPLVSDMTTVLVGLAMIGGFTEFALPFILTGGGPSHSTEFLVTWSIKQAFEMNRMSYGTAISVVLLAIVLIFTFFYLRAREGISHEY